MKICHLTSVHKQHDVRIFLKECSSLAKYHQTHLIVVNGHDEVKNNVTIHGLKVDFNSRLQRFTKAVRETYKKALEINADVYHLHDPELLRIAVKLKKKGKKVIYDAHEDLPRQILSKPYIDEKISTIIAYLIEKYENKIVRKLDAIVGATPHITKRFKKINEKTFNINNYPLLEEIELNKSETINDKKNICYVGGITKIRGIHNVIDALSEVNDINLFLAGEFSSQDYKNEIKIKKGWDKVTELGFISRTKSKNIKNECFAGIVTFLPEDNHINAQPNKIFEYMSSGLCVIGSNFKLWKEIIEGNEVGICVDPENSNEIKNAIINLAQNPKLVQKMGANGIKAIKEIYNWSIEEKKLLALYRTL
jgi:glycosyltransferase involved in cell wall biosynthesis